MYRKKSRAELFASVAVAALATTCISCSTFSLASEKKAQDISSSSTETTKVIAELNEKTFITFDGDQFGYMSWGNLQSPKKVIIGSHGISGASADFGSLGDTLKKKSPDTALYAYNLRGQGLDPIKERRGDIRNHTDWYNDLYTFTKLIRLKHPKATIIWYGESMGGLISINALLHKHDKSFSCDKLILSAPITNIDDKIAPWQKNLMRGFAQSFPKFRISLTKLSGGNQFEITKDTNQEEAVSDDNHWHVERYTLRLMSQLSCLIESMNSAAKQVTLPVYIIQGGKDFLSNKEDIKVLKNSFPKQKTTTLKYYPDAFHLILYDEHKEKIFTELLKWLNE